MPVLVGMQEAQEKSARQQAEKERKLSRALKNREHAQANRAKREAVQQAIGSKEGKKQKKRKGQQSDKGGGGKGGAPCCVSRGKHTRDDSGLEDAGASSTDDEEGSMSEHNTSEPSDAGAKQSEGGGVEQFGGGGGRGRGRGRGGTWGQVST